MLIFLFCHRLRTVEETTGRPREGKGRRPTPSLQSPSQRTGWTRTKFMWSQDTDVRADLTGGGPGLETDQLRRRGQWRVKPVVRETLREEVRDPRGPTSDSKGTWSDVQ